MSQQTFDPTRYLTKVSGRDYLEVKWRLVWLRSVHPDAQVETELVEHRNNMAVFRARVTVPSGASGTGWGSEGTDDFGDYLEKAETKALGRALAALGFGTQFCWDFDFGAEQQRTVDGAVDVRGSTRRPASSNARQMPERPAGRGNGPSGGRISERQIKYVHVLAREAGWERDDVHNAAVWFYGVDHTDELTSEQAREFIDWLQQKPPRPVHPDQQPLDMGSSIEVEGRQVDPATGEVLPPNGDAENGYWDLDGSLLPPAVTGDPSQDVRAVEAAASEAWMASQIEELAAFVRHHDIGDDTLLAGLRERHRELAAKKR